MGHLSTIPVRPFPHMVQWDGMNSRVSLHYGNMIWDSIVVIPSPNGRPLALLDIPRISGPKETIATLSSSVGEILEATYPGGLSRNELQISNFKRRVSTQVSDIPKSSGIRDEANELYTVMMKAHLEDKDVKFCRDIKAYPDLAIVVASAF